MMTKAMKVTGRRALASGLSLAAASLVVAGTAQAASPYPAMAPVGDYLMDRTAEVAMARTAAPASVSADATVLSLTAKGYVTAAKGKNGFTCLVERAWFSGLKDEGFWNPKLRAAVCYNREAAKSVLPTFMTRTGWVLSGASQAEVLKRTHAAMAAKQIPVPAVGSVTYMLSKQSYLGDTAKGPWRPHIMFYMPPMATADWGADAAGSPIQSSEAGVDPYTMFYVLVAKWSDGTPDEAAAAHHTM